MSRRYLVLHLPRLATDRIRQREPDLAGVPIAVWAMQGNRRLLTGVDAPGTTLHVGQALADAQAMHPELVLRTADPDGDMTFLERLALWAMRFTPIAAPDPPGPMHDPYLMHMDFPERDSSGESRPTQPEPKAERVTDGDGRSS